MPGGIGGAPDLGWNLNACIALSVLSQGGEPGIDSSFALAEGHSCWASGPGPGALDPKSHLTPHMQAAEWPSTCPGGSSSSLKMPGGGWGSDASTTPA